MGTGRPANHRQPTTPTSWPTAWSAQDGSSIFPAATTSVAGSSSRASPASGSRCPSGVASSTRATSPRTSPPRHRRPFAVEEGARVVPVNDLVHLDEAPRQYVVVGSGKTATDACVWLLTRRRRLRTPSAGCVRASPGCSTGRCIVPDPAIYLPMLAALLEAAGTADSLDQLFLRLEDAGIMLRIDRSVTPTMAKAPTLGLWELDLLRSIEDVVRLRPHPVGAPRPSGARRGLGRASPTTRSSSTARPTGSRCHRSSRSGRPTRSPLQSVRAGFPCFGAAIAGYVEATSERRRREEPAVPARHRSATPCRTGRG